jgi:hypothetical protein
LGHESGLRDEVLRRREAQWAALEEAKPRAVAASLKSDWLERASGAGSEVLRRVRDDLCSAAALRRESLVLDLRGGHGFVTWEALRRCVEGGVWTRCDSVEEQTELEAWIRRVDPLHRPVIRVAALEALPAVLRGEAEPPRFDVVLGLGVDPPSVEWMEELRTTTAPSTALARWALAFRRPLDLRDIPWDEWLAAAPGALREKIASVPPTPRTSPGEEWEKQLLAAGWKVRREARAYEDRRRLTPTQAREWLDRAGAGEGSLASLRAALEPVEWDALCAYVVAHLADGLRVFPAGYDVVTAVKK